MRPLWSFIAAIPRRTLMVVAITLWWLIPFAVVGAVVLYRLIIREQQRIRRETPPSAPAV